MEEKPSFERPSHRPARARRVHGAGRAGVRRHARGAAAAAARTCRRTGSAWRAGWSSRDNPLTARVDGEPALGAALRPRPRRDERGLRHAGRAAVASGAARLAGRGVHATRAGARRRCCGRSCCRRRTGRTRRSSPALQARDPVQPAARPRAALPPGGRDGARRGAGGERAAEPRRSAGRACSRRSRPASGTTRTTTRQWIDEHGRGPVPPQPLHVLAAHGAVPDVHDLRRHQPRVLHRAPRADEHAAAGAGHAQRRGLRRGRARRWPAACGRRPAPTVDARLAHGFRLVTSRRADRDGTGIDCAPSTRRRRHGTRPRPARPPRPSTCRRTRRSTADELDLAAWTMVGNVLLNLDETITQGMSGSRTRDPDRITVGRE